MLKLRYFIMGYSFSALMIAGFIGYHGWKAYVKVKPAIADFKEGNPLPEKQKDNIEQILMKVGSVAELINNGEMINKIYLSAASILNSKTDPKESIKIQYYFLKSIEGGERHALKNSEYNGLLTARLGYSVFLINHGEAEKGMNYLKDSLQIAEQKSKGSEAHRKITEALSSL